MSEKNKKQKNNLEEKVIKNISGGISTDKIINTPTFLKAEDWAFSAIAGATDTSGKEFNAVLLNGKWVWCPKISGDSIKNLLIKNDEEQEYNEEILGWINKYEAGNDVEKD